MENKKYIITDNTINKILNFLGETVTYRVGKQIEQILLNNIYEFDNINEEGKKENAS